MSTTENNDRPTAATLAQGRLDWALAELGAAVTAGHLNLLAGLVLDVKRAEGRVAGLQRWAEVSENLADKGAGLGWSPVRLLVAKQAVIGTLLGRDPDDTWSGRGNDARRAFADGWRDALVEIARFDLEAEAEAAGL